MWRAATGSHLWLQAVHRLLELLPVGLQVQRGRTGALAVVEFERLEQCPLVPIQPRPLTGERNLAYELREVVLLDRASTRRSARDNAVFAYLGRCSRN